MCFQKSVGRRPEIHTNAAEQSCWWDLSNLGACLLTFVPLVDPFALKNVGVFFFVFLWISELTCVSLPFGPPHAMESFSCISVENVFCQDLSPVARVNSWCLLISDC